MKKRTTTNHTTHPILDKVVNTALIIGLAILLLKLLNVGIIPIILILMIGLPIGCKLFINNDVKKRTAQEWCSIFGGTWFIKYFQLSDVENFNRTKIELDAYRVLILNGFYNSDINRILEAENSLLKNDTSIVNSKLSILLNIVHLLQCDKDVALETYKKDPKEAAQLSDIAMARPKK